MLQVCWFLGPAGRPCLGLVGDGGVYDLSVLQDGWTASFDALLSLRRDDLLNRVSSVDHRRLPHYPLDGSGDAVRLLAPLQSQEIWAAGVTYVRSREARTEEAVTKD